MSGTTGSNLKEMVIIGLTFVKYSGLYSILKKRQFNIVHFWQMDDNNSNITDSSILTDVAKWTVHEVADAYTCYPLCPGCLVFTDCNRSKLGLLHKCNKLK